MFYLADGLNGRSISSSTAVVVDVDLRMLVFRNGGAGIRRGLLRAKFNHFFALSSCWVPAVLLLRLTDRAGKEAFLQI